MPIRIDALRCALVHIGALWLSSKGSNSGPTEPVDGVGYPPWSVRESSIRRLSRIHRLVFEVTGGVIGRRLVANDMLLLTTIGRRSGKPHTVPLLYIEDGDRFVVIASFGGRQDHPAWYLNLTANPNVEVQVRNRRFPAIATTASREDRSRLWPQITETYRGYAAYQKRTDRTIPVVFLDPL
jgi:deazaflavin-dependent oxidoreductase (nitroreductase family)